MAAGEYQVLILNEITGEWREIGVGEPAEVRASKGDQGVFVDVPTRSWNPYVRETDTRIVTRTKPYTGSATPQAAEPQEEAVEA